MEPEKNEKKAGGRRKKEPGHKRNHPGWGFTQEEITAIMNEFSKSQEQNIGAFIFKKVTNQPLKRAEMANFPDDLKRDFKGICNNINQIAAILNTKKADPLSPEMLNQLRIIGRQFSFLVERIDEK